jgi:hypothetical protein
MSIGFVKIRILRTSPSPRGISTEGLYQYHLWKLLYERYPPEHLVDTFRIFAFLPEPAVHRNLLARMDALHLWFNRLDLHLTVWLPTSGVAE